MNLFMKFADWLAVNWERKLLLAVFEVAALTALFYGPYQASQHEAYYEATFGSVKCYDEISCIHEQGHVTDVACAPHRWIFWEYCSQRPSFQLSLLNCAGGDPLLWHSLRWDYTETKSINIFLFESYAELYTVVHTNPAYSHLDTVEELMDYACPPIEAQLNFTNALQKCLQAPEISWCENYLLPEGK